TARVWRNWVSTETLTGHEQAVWAVLDAPGYGILTGSADKLIKLWNDGRCVKTMAGHTDVVRALALVPSAGFISASNDSTLRFWNLQGDCIRELVGHTSFVYSLAVLPSGEYVSCGEDRTLRVWTDGSCTQTITHPCTSVWCVTALPNGDVMTGGSDGVIRVFSRAEARLASSDDIKASQLPCPTSPNPSFDEAVANQALPSNQIGDVDKTKLPGPEALLMPGRPGQVIMVRAGGGEVEAHQWDGANQEWQKVGEVVDAVSSSRKQVYQGREYDYVFEIDIGGGANLKLPYNATENPYTAAQRFIDLHELSQDFLDQIADFIVKNTGGADIGPAQPGAYADPFTGGSRYVPGGGSAQPSQPSAPTKPQLLPITTYAQFQALNPVAVKNKIAQFQDELVAANDSARLTSEETNLIAVVVGMIQKQRPFDHFEGMHLAALKKVAFGWPAHMRFPGLDLLRVTALHAAGRLRQDAGFLGGVLAAARLGEPLAAAPGRGEEANAMLALRLVCNLFASEDGRRVVESAVDQLVSLFGKGYHASANVNLRVAYVSFLLNLTILLRAERTDEHDVELAGELVEVLKHETDPEVEKRALSALGTLVHGNATGREAAGLLGARAAVLTAAARIVGGGGDSRLRSEVLALLPAV
ncbi:hypothetical protein HK405_003290, partial [Cladochytrium tenue]